MKTILPLFCALLLCATSFSQPLTNNVSIANGQQDGADNDATRIRSFKGIPYALPPVGERRWKEPEAPANWQGVLKADHFSHMPMQKSVYADMIFRAETMAQKGIVSLTIYYRLGIFGFFSHPELTAESAHHASGNYGLLDQYAALKWVKANIAAFGGDPDKITIAGESAGSIAVSAQMASPLSKGLIAGAIGESGAMIKPTLPAIPLA